MKYVVFVNLNFIKPNNNHSIESISTNKSNTRGSSLVDSICTCGGRPERRSLLLIDLSSTCGRTRILFRISVAVTSSDVLFPTNLLPRSLLKNRFPSCLFNMSLLVVDSWFPYWYLAILSGKDRNKIE